MFLSSKILDDLREQADSRQEVKTTMFEVPKSRCIHFKKIDVYILHKFLFLLATQNSPVAKKNLLNK